jgi:hypothetical protein
MNWRASLSGFDVKRTGSAGEARRVIATALIGCKTRHVFDRRASKRSPFSLNKCLQTTRALGGWCFLACDRDSCCAPCYWKPSKGKTTSERAPVLEQRSPTTVRTECVGSKDVHLCLGAAIVQNPRLYL